jgi:hypothetical protein
MICKPKSAEDEKLTHFISNFDEVVLSKDAAKDLLAVSDLFSSDVGKSKAVQALNKIWMPAAEKLELARKFTLQDWLEPALERLWWETENGLGCLDDERLDNVAIVALARGRMYVHQCRQFLAFCPPVTTFAKAENCDDKKHTRCLRSWKKTWLAEMPAKLLHPTNPLNPILIPGELRKMAFPEMTTECLPKVLVALEELDQDPFDFEDKVLKEVLRKVEEYYGFLDKAGAIPMEP